MAPTSTAVFRAVADFASLNRNVKQTRAEIEKLQRQSGKTGDWDRFDASLNKISETQKKLRGETKLLNTEQAKLGRSAGTSNLATALGRLTTATDKARTSTTALSAAQSRQQGVLGQTRGEVGSLAASMRSLSQAETNATKSAQNHAKSLADERNSASQKIGVIDKLRGALERNAQADRNSAAAADEHAEALNRESVSAQVATERNRELGTSTTNSGRAAQISAGDHDLLAEALGRLTPAAAGARDSLRGHADASTDAGSSSRAAADGQTSLASALERIAPAARNASASSRDASSSFRDVSTSARSGDGDVTRFASSVTQAGNSSRSSSAGMSALSGALNPLKSSFNQAGAAGQGFKTIIAGLMIASAVPGITLLVGSLSALVSGLVSVVAAAGPAVGALAALGPAAIAAAGAIGTTMLAFRGVGDALKAMTKLDQEAGASAGQSAAQRRAAANAIGAAQRGVRDAIQGQQDAERQGARAVEDAQRSLDRARRDAADAAVAASRRVEDANRALVMANQRVLRAEQDLHDARRQAVRDLEDLADRTGDNALSLEGAEIRLLRAQERQREVNASATSTALDRREAALSVAEAEEHLSDVQRQSARDATDLNEAQKGGVDGMPGVVSAQESLSGAMEAQRSAAQDLQDAQAAAVRQQQDSAERIGDAERNLAEAREDAARRNRDAAERVQDAMLRLAEAQASASESSGKMSAASRDLAAALEKLSPQGLRLVEMLRALQPRLDDMSKTAQEAMFPGLIRALEILTPMIDSVAIPSITAFGKALGWVAETAATEIRSWEKDLVDFGTGAGPQLIREFGQILVNLAGTMEDVGVAAVPLLQWLSSLGLRLSEYWEREAQAGRKSGELAAYFDRVRFTLELLGNILFNIGGIFKEVFRAASPSGVGILEDFEELTRRTREWMGTAEGRNRMAEYFERVRPNFEIIMDLLGQIGLAFIKMGESETLTVLLESIRDSLAPAISRLFQNIGESMREVGPQLVQLFTDILDFFSTLMEQGNSGGLSAFISVLSTFVQGLNALVSIPGIPAFITAIMGLVGAMVALKAIGKITGLSAIAGAINNRAGARGAGVAPAPATAAQGFIAGATGRQTAGPAQTGTARLGQAAGGFLRGGAQTAAGAAVGAFDRRYQTQPYDPSQQRFSPGAGAPAAAIMGRGPQRALPAGPTPRALPAGGLGPIAPPQRYVPPPVVPGSLARGGPQYPRATGAPLPARGPIALGPGPSASTTQRGKVGTTTPDPAKTNAAAKATQNLDRAQQAASRSAGTMASAAGKASAQVAKVGSAASSAATATSKVGTATAGAATAANRLGQASGQAAGGVRAVGAASTQAAGQVRQVGSASTSAATQSTRAFSGVGSRIGSAFSSATGTAGKALSGLRNVASTAATGASDAFKNTASRIGQHLAPSASRVSTALAPAATAATTTANRVGDAFKNTAGRIGTALQPVTSRVSSALAPAQAAATTAANRVGDAFKNTAGRIGTALAPVGQRISGAFTTGVAGATAAAGQVGESADRMAASTERSTSRIGTAFRNMGSSISGAATGVADRFRGVGTAAEGAGRAAENAGRTAAGAAGGLGSAGAAAAGAATRFGGLRSAASGFSAFLGGPWGLAIVGAVAAIGALTWAYQEFGSKAEENAKKAIDGSLNLQAAIKAEQEQADKSYLFYISANQQKQAHADAQARVTEEYRKAYEALSPLQQAESDAAQAQWKYNEEVKRFGVESPQAREAAELWRLATDKVELEQKAASDATKSHTERIQEQRDLLFGSLDADLAKQQSLLRVKDSQDNLNAAVAEHGPSSRQAQEASLTLQESMLGYIQRAGDAAVKTAEMNGETDTAKARLDAQNAAAIELAKTHEGPLPEALMRVIAGMDESALSAEGATIKTDEFGNRVATLDGKTVILDANRQPGDVVIDGFEQRGIPPKTVDVHANTKPADDTLAGWFRGLWNRLTGFFTPAPGGPDYISRGPAGAGGGVIPGYAPGRDTVPAMLSPGEAVLVPELVKKIGAKNILRANKEASGRATGLGGPSQHFAAGGIVGRRRPAATGAADVGGAAAPPATTAPAPVDAAGAAAAAKAIGALTSQMTALTPQLKAAQAAGTALVTSSLQPLAQRLGVDLVTSLTSLREQGLLPLRTDLALTQTGTDIATQAMTGAVQLYDSQVNAALANVRTAGLLPLRTDLTTTQLHEQMTTTAMTNAMNLHRDLSNAAMLGIRTLGLNPLRTDLTTTQLHEQMTTTAMTNAMNLHRDMSNAATLAVREAGLNPLRADLTTTQVHTGVETGIMSGQTEAFRDRANLALQLTREGLAQTSTAVGETQSWWTQQMDAMKVNAQNPVRDVLNGPFNGGIIAAWNSLNSQFALGKAVQPVAVPFATGGAVPGTGNRDSVPAVLTPGEFVLSKQAIKGLGGIDNVARLHQLARMGLIGPNQSLGRGRQDARDRQQMMAKVSLDDLPVPFAYGGVAPHVAAAGDEITRVFGRMPGGIGGVGARANASDHPKGLALDFMTMSDRGLGDRVAGFLTANAQRMAVKYLIWKQAINSGSGWRGMEDRGSITANHFDHVHASFLGAGIAGGAFSGAGAFFDPTPIVNAAFDDTYKKLDEVASKYPNEHAARIVAIGRQATDMVKAKALETVRAATAMFGGMGAGAPVSGDVVSQVKQVAAQFGWAEGPQWDALSRLIQKESSWNPNAANPTSSARGLFQKMTSIHGPVEPTAGGQAQWGLNYIRSRYGSPSAALAFHNRNNYYARGGLVPGQGNGDTQPAMLTPGEFVLRRSAVDALGMQQVNALNALRPGAFSPNAAQHFALGGVVQRDGGPAYQIRYGDTLSKIAKDYGTTIAELQRLNSSIKDPDKIYSGRWLTLPRKESGSDESLLQAAKLILERLKSGSQLYEDWTWAGAPSVVGQFNDKLQDLFQESGDGRSSKSWLESFVKSGGKTSSESTDPAKTADNMLDAAKAVLERVKNGDSLDSDWYWKGSPFSKKLLDELEDLYDDPAGRKMGKQKWLEDYIAKGGSDSGSGDDSGSDPGTDPGTGTGISLDQWAQGIAKTTAEIKEFEDNLLKLSGWGYDDLALALAKMGAGGSGSAESANGLELSRQATKSPSAAAAVEKIIEDSATVIGDSLENALAVIGALRKTPGLGIREVATATKIDTKDIFEAMSQAKVLAEVSKLPEANRSKFLSNWDAYKKGLPFAFGGRVPGSGRGDTVPAMLTPGEFVLRKDAAKAIGIQGLERLNKADSLPTQQFAAGGAVLRAEDLFSFVGTPRASRPTLGKAVQERLTAAIGRSGDTTNSKSVVFNEGAVKISNPAPARSVDSFESTMQKLTWAGAFS